MNHRRLMLAAALLLTVIAGLSSRHFPLGFRLWDKFLGDALYAVAVYLVIALFLPRASPVALVLLGSMACLGIELFKLTGYPAAWIRFPVSRLLFGSTFALENLVCYAAGSGAAAAIDALLRRRASAA